VIDMGATPVKLHVVKTPVSEGIVRPGDVLEGRYRLQQLIGDGGMGTVFLAEHVLIKRRVAIKVLHPELARDADVVERFMNEARAAGTLGHPNIVESTDMGFARHDVPYIVFEYLDGSLLSDEIYRLGGLTVRRAVKIAHQIASALEAAHRANIIHRDLKSDNIFLTDREDALDVVKVLDFGISRFLEAEQDWTGRGSGVANKRNSTMMGTPEFMAPEQIMAPERVDARTDIYALGVVLYEMLAGRTPFLNDKTDVHKVLHEIILDRPPPLAREDLPAGFADMLFDKLLAKDPEARYQTMSEVQAALDAFTSVMTRKTLDNQQPPLPAVAAPVVLSPPLRRRWPWLLAALVVLGGAGAGGFVLYQQQMRSELAATDTAASAPVEGNAAPKDGAARTLGELLDAKASAALLRVEGFATSPVLRAAIETDSATLEDMARDGAVLMPQPGEILEVFQAPATTLLRMPSAAAALPAIPQRTVALVRRGSATLLVAAAPVLKTNGVLGGSLSLAIPVEVPAGLAIRDGALVLDGVAVPTKLVKPHQE
jgi:eukaryotic-like serine/threonine-protein kinase